MATADLSNWREAPHNIWAFQNVDRFIATHPVNKSEQTISPFSINPQAFDGFKIDTGSSDFDLPAFLKETNTDGLVLLHKGELIYEHYDNGNTRSSKHILMSMTKSVAGLIVSILSEQGKLDVNAPVRSYVPEASKVFDGVTVRDCLDMRSGVRLTDTTTGYRAAAGWTPLGAGLRATNLHEFIEGLDVPTDELPTAFSYASINTDLMGWIIERVTGKKFAEVVGELLWQPMGAESDAHITVDAAGNARAAGGLCATVRDVARVGQLVLDGGREIVPSSWIEDLVHGGDKDAFARSTWAPAFKGLQDFPAPAYRSFWTVGDNVLLALGIHGQHLIVDRKNKLVMAKTSSQAGSSDFAKVRMALRAFEEFRRILLS